MATPKLDQRQLEEILRCGKDPKYFIKTYAKIQHPVKGLLQFKTYPFQDDCVDEFKKHRFNIVLKSRQLGLSTVTAAYSVWQAIFYQQKNILVIATKLTTAINFIKKVKVVVSCLPSWLLIPKMIGETKSSITFDNGSQIVAVPTSPDAGRSEALSLLIVDECVDGDTIVTIRDKTTLDIISLPIRDLYTLMKAEQLENTSYVYLEDDGHLDT